MNPLDTSVTDQFSPGSSSLICAQAQSSSCLVDPNTVSLVREGICGNGVKDENEDCDCGLPEDCTDACCEATTCRFKPGAVCSTSNDKCCSESCQFLPSSTKCHTSGGSCDTDAFCPGVNGTCPSDTFLADGTECLTPSVIYDNRISRLDVRQEYVQVETYNVKEQGWSQLLKLA